MLEKCHSSTALIPIITPPAIKSLIFILPFDKLEGYCYHAPMLLLQSYIVPLRAKVALLSRFVNVLAVNSLRSDLCLPFSLEGGGSCSW